MKKIAFPLNLTTALLTATLTLFTVQAAIAETLQTRNFRVTVTRNCAEGSVTCNDVTYVGRNRRTGESIRLRGKTLHTLCQDGVTPCRFLGLRISQRGLSLSGDSGGNLARVSGQKTHPG